MIEANPNHCQIVTQSMTGEKTVDEQTFASLAILTERLERLKKVDSLFFSIAFSSAVKKLKAQRSAVAV